MDRHARLAELFDRYHDRLVRYLKLSFRLSTDDALDFTQHVFFRMFATDKFPDQYDERREWAFLKVAARHVAVDSFRRWYAPRPENLLQLNEDRFMPEALIDFQTPEDLLEFREEVEHFQRAINELPQDLQLCISLQIRGYDRIQIAERLGLDVPEVSKRLRTARSRLLRLVVSNIAIARTQSVASGDSSFLLDLHAPDEKPRAAADSRAILRLAENIEQLARRHRQLTSQLDTYEVMLFGHSRYISDRLERAATAIGREE